MLDFTFQGLARVVWEINHHQEGYEEQDITYLAQVW